MTRASLADTGPLIALFDEDDPNHSRCVEALASLSPPLITTWPVIAEAMYRLQQIGGMKAQRLLWDTIDEGRLLVAELDAARRQWMRHYMERYEDRPCDLADASLLALAEENAGAAGGHRGRRLLRLRSFGRIGAGRDTRAEEGVGVTVVGKSAFRLCGRGGRSGMSGSA